MEKQSPKSSETCWAILPAAGIGSRMGTSKPKQYLPLNGKTLLEHSLQPLLDTPWIKTVVVAIAENDPYWFDLSVSKHPKIETVTGGNERVDSVRNALIAIRERCQNEDFVLVHDAARPCLKLEDLEKLYAALQTADAGVVLADRISDTVKRDKGDSTVLKTVPRTGLWRALTPQAFHWKLLIEALIKTGEVNNSLITDESSAVEGLGLSPLLIQGCSNNIKVTTEGDLQLASLILQIQNSSKKVSVN
ncbi:MAG: 2-C-methyl-D-erythritol 4-phosphate cytidylyltransferase [Gammaproteobacteria bacterium]|nr:2-C-methyl-D-erythritol 4-phosphate cytidylyltransferase [Gammaproteobacteria bacterium]